MTHFRPLLRVGGRLLQPVGFFQRLFWGLNVTDSQMRNRLAPQANSIRLLAEQLVSVYGSADVRRLNYELPRRSLNRQRQRDRDLRKSATSADFFATVNCAGRTSGCHCWPSNARCVVTRRLRNYAACNRIAKISLCRISVLKTCSSRRR